MDTPTGKTAIGKKQKQFHHNLLKQWLLTKQEIEVWLEQSKLSFRARSIPPGQGCCELVRSLENGFLGSWHMGEVVGVGKTRVRIKYENVLSNNGSGNLVEWVPVGPAIWGEFTNQDNSSYRCNIRPLPPKADLPMWSLYYGKCVDMHHEDAWWEGVIFDHEDGCDVRKVFFPDMGDEMTSDIKDLRLTQDWDEFTREWKPRGDWLFLKLIEEVEFEWPQTVSVKQAWYDVRMKEGFKKLMEWTSSSTQIWKELLLEVIFNNLLLTAKSFFHDLNGLEDMKQEAHLSLELSGATFEHFMKRETVFDDSICHSVEMETEPFNLALDKLSAQIERNSLNESPCEEGCAMSVLPLNDQHTLVIGADFVKQERPSVSLKKSIKKRKWLPDAMAPEGEYFPNAITEYMNHRAKSKDLTTKMLKVKRHLIYMGWKIESCKFGETIRKRYISPSNVIYRSLVKACQTMPSESAATSNSESNKSDCLGASNILVPFSCTEESLPIVMQSESISYYEPVHVESNFFPQAVTEYLLANTPKAVGYRKRVMVSKAKEHLAAVGWKFNVSHRRGRVDVQYLAPTGHIFYSLLRACRWYAKPGSLASHKEETREPAVKSLHFSSSGGSFDNDLSGNPSTDTNSMHTLFSDFSEPVVGRFHGTGKRRKRKKRNKPLGSCAISLLAKRRKSKDLTMQRNDARTEYSKNVHKTCKVDKTLRSILSRLIDRNVVLPGSSVYYQSQKDVRPMKGQITREGIKCTCCECIFTPGKFETHAGSSCRKPFENIFLEDGRTLLECQLQLKRENNLRNKTSERHAKGKWVAITNNDHICSSCNYGGELVLCDGCPSSFHASCIGLKEVPDDDWFCPSCCCGLCLSRLSRGSEPCINEKTLRCAQCEKKYHAECFKSKSLTKFDGDTEGNWFCNRKCENIYCSLRNILGKPILLGIGNLTCTWLKHENCEDSNRKSQKNKELMRNYRKLNTALSVFHECFKPVKEPLTRRDLVEDVLFNSRSELQRINFSGFYTVLLERKGKLITVATVRVHGDKVAEIPLIGTRFQFRRKGMCRILMDNIEKKLLELGVENLVLPAVPSLLETWTTSFGFSVMSESDRIVYMHYVFLGFHGSTMCQKILMNSSSSKLLMNNPSSELCQSIDDQKIATQRNMVVFEGPQADLNEGSEMVDQGSSIGTGCNGGYLSVSTSVTVDNGPCPIEQNKVIDMDSAEGNDIKRYMKCYQRKNRQNPALLLT